MSTLAKVKSAAKKLGATVIDEKIGESHTCQVEAPKGYHWECGLHEFVDGSYRPWKPDYQDLLDRMSHGVKLCGPNCEWW